MIAKPKNLDPDAYFTSYIESLLETDLYEALENTKMETIAALKSIPVDREGYAYAEGKWTVKQLAQHLVDCERILNYRALAIARKEPINLNGFDENLYVQNDYSEARTLSEICDEFEITRISTQMLVKSFHPEILDHIGKANGAEVTPRSIIWFIAGHNIHHVKVMKERYF